MSPTTSPTSSLTTQPTTNAGAMKRPMPLLRRIAITGAITGAITTMAGLSACGTDATSQSTQLTQASTAMRTADNPFEPTPDSDAFYTPQTLDNTTPGSILKVRPITYSPAGLTLPNPAWQILYATRDTAGKPAAAVVTVIKPMIPSVTGQPVLVSFQHAYDSLGARCTPSKTATGSMANQTNMAETLEYLPGLQTLGWTVIVPDYEGTRHAWGANRLQGQATLDAVRAALSFEELGLSAKTPVALWGYSGGAWATSWAASLQPGYAPQINLVGSVAGGTPVEFLALMKAKENTTQFNFLFSAIMGMAREFKDLLSPQNLTPRGLAAVNTLKDACVGVPENAEALPAARLSDYVQGEDPYSSDVFKQVERANTLLTQAFAPKTDIYMYHEVNDELVPVSGADKLAALWCQRGVPLTYFRNAIPAQLNNPAVGIHLAGAAVGTAPSTAYIQSRLAGVATLTPPGSVRCN